MLWLPDEQQLLVAFANGAIVTFPGINSSNMVSGCEKASNLSFESGSAGLEKFTNLENTMTFVLLALPEDKISLSPLRCFLREQVCAFAATEKYIAARGPKNFPITIGQVGIGCIYCVKQSARHRSNRAYCFPWWPT